MFSELIQLSFDKILQTHTYTVVILAAPEAIQNKRFAIYTEPSVGKALQMYLTGTEKQRPLTHDLLSMVLKGFEIRVKQVVINDLQDTVYYARLYLEYDGGTIRNIMEIDARPSDCIILALMNNAPVYCTREVLDKTLPVEE